MSSNTRIVGEFIEAWAAMDLERIMGFFHEDAVYTNMPIDPPNHGLQEIRATVAGFLGMAQAVEFIVHHSAENPASGIVMNERTDRFKIGEHWAEAGVMGVFELSDGKIKAWRDYFDMAQFQQSMAG